MSLILFGPPVHFDFGVRKLLPQIMASARCHKPLFVTDRGVMAAGVFDRGTAIWFNESAV
jgi:alcohol dehydrogenase class IV